MTTHVIDTSRGNGAGGLCVDVFRIDDAGNAEVLRKTVATSEGRTRQWLVDDGDLVPGRYEVRLALGEYFQGHLPLSAVHPFFGMVRLRVEVSRPDQHLHLPVLVSPWGYSVYRGS